MRGGGQGLIIGILLHVIFNEKSFRLLGIRVKTPGARFSKFPKSFRAQKTLCLQSCSFDTILIRTKLTSMQSLMPIHCFRFEIQIIYNGFTGPTSYRVFGETGPGFLFPDSIFQVDPSPGYQAFNNFESDFDTDMPLVTARHPSRKGTGH